MTHGLSCVPPRQGSWVLTTIYCPGLLYLPPLPHPAFDHFLLTHPSPFSFSVIVHSSILFLLNLLPPHSSFPFLSFHRRPVSHCLFYLGLRAAIDRSDKLSSSVDRTLARCARSHLNLHGEWSLAMAFRRAYKTGQ